MNEADLPSINLDELRLVPDWLRDESPSPSKQYAAFDRPPENDYPDRRGPRPGGQGRDRRDSRGGGGGGGERRNDRGRSGPPPRGGGGPRRDERPPARQENFQPIAAAPIRVEFLPDERCMASIIKQIRSTHMAYPLFSLARMFLQEPARHFVQLSLVPGALPGAALYQLGDDGPVTLDRASLEALAFDAMKERFYKEETVQKDPPKGNFTNVARERQSGTLLGPTNYHGYQPALRALYESRYSRRMSFDDYRRNIEVSNDPALVERWKEEARTVTTISTMEGEPPTVFPSNAETKVHFRQTHLESLLHKGMSFRLHGSVARRLPEPAVMQALREAHEREVRYPAQFVQLLRQGLQNAGLHIFKHRKRIVYVAATRPTPFVPSSGAVTENVSLILETIAASPACTRKFLAERVLGKTFKSQRRQSSRNVAAARPAEQAAPGLSEPGQAEAEPSVVSEDLSQPNVREAPTPSPEIVEGSTAGTATETPAPAQTEAASAESDSPSQQPVENELSRAKAALAADLRFLVQAGHIIEFHNATFDLPLTPKPKEESTGKGQNKTEVTPDDGSSAIGADPASVIHEAESAPAASSSVETSGADLVTETVATSTAAFLEQTSTEDTSRSQSASPSEIDSTVSIPTASAMAQESEAGFAVVPLQEIDAVTEATSDEPKSPTSTAEDRPPLE